MFSHVCIILILAKFSKCICAIRPDRHTVSFHLLPVSCDFNCRSAMYSLFLVYILLQAFLRDADFSSSDFHHLQNTSLSKWKCLSIWPKPQAPNPMPLTVHPNCTHKLSLKLIQPPNLFSYSLTLHTAPLTYMFPGCPWRI